MLTTYITVWHILSFVLKKNDFKSENERIKGTGFGGDKIDKKSEWEIWDGFSAFVLPVVEKYLRLYSASKCFLTHFLRSIW